MLIQSYKNYVQFLEKPRVSTLQKILLFMVGLTFVLLGSSSAFLYWQYQKLQPVRYQNQYLEIASSGFIGTNQSIEETLNTFKVLGTKVKIIDELKEASSASSGFFVPLDDLNKTIANIQSVQKSLLFQKEQLEELSPPGKFQNIHDQLKQYYDQTAQTFAALEKEQKFTRDLLLALGPNFYLPVLTNETLWQLAKGQDIIDYYQKIKGEANQTLANLAHLEPPQEFQQYHDTQLAYLELLIKTATKITEVLSEDDKLEKDGATQLEIAYQVLTGAKRENEQIAEKLLAERLKFISQKENFAKLASVKIRQNAINGRLADIYNSQPQTASYRFPELSKFFDFPRNLFNYVTSFKI
ncbi:hypothetical protein HYU92_04040 [Candidatus Curtissbacteria bacterium]|nr:hypothetical protein [Candidatus Curtissbacteria bacterium]